MLAVVLCATACEATVPPLPEPPPAAPIPAIPVEPGVAFLRDAHADMSRSSFGDGGLRHWDAAVGSLRAAREELDGDARFTALLPDLDALLQGAEEVQTEEAPLRECDTVLNSTAREDDPARYDACWQRFQDSKARRRALHDRMAQILQRAELAR